jgi:type II secretory pathway pseudopilin PulG
MRDSRNFTAFTLLEILVVITLIAILLIAIIPAVTTLKPAGDLTTAAYTISDALQQARTYAMANNTYVWVGFYEEDINATSATNAAPPYLGKGRVVLASVASKDGTSIFGANDPSASLPSTQLVSVGKPIKIENIHLTDVGAPPSPTPVPAPPADRLDSRPDWPYTNAAGVGADHFNRINSESPDKTKFTFTTQNYTYYKTVRFNPRGEANINSTYSLKVLAEIGLRPTHGNIVDANTLNVVAIQFSGVAGNLKIYRR